MLNLLQPDESNIKFKDLFYFCIFQSKQRTLDFLATVLAIDLQNSHICFLYIWSEAKYFCLSFINSSSLKPTLHDNNFSNFSSS